MKPIIFCGFQNTGKTIFIQKAIRGLIKSGFSVSTVKHVPEKFTHPSTNKDTERFLSQGAQISIAVSENEVFIQKREKVLKGENIREILHRILSTLHTDFALIEGFKTYSGPIPRLVFGNTMEQVENLVDELTIGYTGMSLPGVDPSIKGILVPGEKVKPKHTISRNQKPHPRKASITPERVDEKGIFVPYIPFGLGEQDLASFLNEKSIHFLGDTDCGECGFPSCRGLAKMILEGKKSEKDCIPLQDDVQLYIDEKRIPMKGFVKSILRGAVEGFIRELKGYEQGDIRLWIKK